MAPQRAIDGLRVAGVVLLAAVLLCGCATPALDSARHNYYAGKVTQADETLEQASIPDKDRVLFLMERGTVRQSAGRYQDSSKDYIEAADLIDQLWTYSVSKGAASWVVKDLHTFYPNKFRTRTEGDKTISTFWPNGYGTALSFEGVATRSPNDPYVHKIGKAIAELRAQKAYCDSIGAPFDDYELKMLTR